MARSAWAPRATPSSTRSRASCYDSHDLPSTGAHGKYRLMGWGPPAVGEIFHDGFIPEFAWEFLCG
jgi:hypothetical protein